MSVSDIIAYEMGELSEEATLNMFAVGIKTGLVWSLQGSYGRTARALIESGAISEDGEVTA